MYNAKKRAKHLEKKLEAMKKVIDGDFKPWIDEETKKLFMSKYEKRKEELNAIYQTMFSDDGDVFDKNLLSRDEALRLFFEGRVIEVSILGGVWQNLDYVRANALLWDDSKFRMKPKVVTLHLDNKNNS